MSFDIPLAIEPQIRRYADAQHITTDEAVVRLIQVGLQASNIAAGDNYDHLFTPSALAHLDNIVANLDAGQETLTPKQVDQRLDENKAKWLAQNAN